MGRKPTHPCISRVLGKCENNPRKGRKGKEEKNNLGGGGRSDQGHEDPGPVEGEEKNPLSVLQRRFK